MESAVVLQAWIMLTILMKMQYLELKKMVISSWQEMIDNEKGNYDYLMYNDIDFRNNYVREELDRWIKWYWDQAHFDGVRLDAVKHISPFFYVGWLHNLEKQHQ